MPPNFRTELTVPADARVQRLVHDYGYSLALLAGFPTAQAELLTQALWEACQNSIAYAYDADDENGLITLVGELTHKALTLGIHDRGLPFDQTLTPKSPPTGPESYSKLPRRGLGLALIHQVADEVRWLNHGLDGKELRLTKYCPGWCRLERQPPPPHQPPVEAAPTRPPQNYTIRLARPEDAIRVAQLMYRVYGYTYPRVDVYYPQRLAHNIATDAHIGVVAVAEDGEIAGHLAMVRSNLGPLAELGQLAVAPLHRGQGLNKRLSDRLQEEIRRLGLMGLYAEAVTVHTISQKGAEAAGLHAAGLEFLNIPVHFKQLEILRHDLGYQDNTSGRGLPGETALVFYFQYLVPPETAPICVPNRHREILTKLYKNLEVPLKFLHPGPLAGQGRLTVECNRQVGAGFIQIQLIGTDTFPEIAQACQDLCHLAGAGVVFLDLPLAQGGTPGLCDAVERIGFFFSGVRPHFAPDGDFLRLQYLNAPLDPARIHLASPFAQELLAYILQDKARVAQNLGTP